MRIHSDTISTYLKKAKKICLEILKEDFKCVVGSKRFSFEGYRWPIILVCIEDPKIIGFFDPNNLTIGLNKNIMYQVGDKTLRDILRHEIAHYLVYAQTKNAYQGHDQGYRDFCRSYNMGPEVYSAKLDIKLEEVKEQSKDAQSIISKVKKLLKLAQSSNQFESEMATTKANEILLKHNIKNLTESEISENWYVKDLPSHNKSSAKLESIVGILKQFLVYPILSHNKAGVHIEMTGKKVNLELAEYVYHFLDIEMEYLYKLHRIAFPKLKGITAKNSFMLGLSQGYIEKIQASKSDLQITHSKELMILESKLQDAFSEVNPNIRRTASHRNFCADSNSQGKKAGASMNINPGLKSKTSNLFLK
jgi:hypothetical protein